MFSNHHSGFEVVYGAFALTSPRVGIPDPGDSCASGQFDFYVCITVTNGLQGHHVHQRHRVAQLW